MAVLPPKISLFRDLTTEEYSKLFEIGTTTKLISGEFLFKQGEPAIYFYVVIKGAIEISQKFNNGEMIVDTYCTDTFFGEVPLLAGTHHIASGKAVVESWVYSLEEDKFWELITKFPSIRKTVLGHVTSRTQEIQMISQHHEKLISLGTLAAGLAHELNNPASAARGAVSQLLKIMPIRDTLSLHPLEQKLTPAQIESLLQFKRHAIENQAGINHHLNSLQQMDLEDRLSSWLEKRGIKESWKFASNLVSVEITIEQLATIIDSRMESDTLRHLLVWLDTTISETNLLNLLEHSINRVFELVQAIKAYSYVDQALVKKKNVNLQIGIENTLTILSYKLKTKNISLVREYPENLPLIQANGSALNQVWTNLIDNAVEAVDKKGTIRIRTYTKLDCVIVEIVDNGPGIPSNIQPRIFEQFYTTKDVGQGTGIGLNLVHRIVVGEHNGTIQCFSKPGHTSFVVSLPINQSQTTSSCCAFSTQNYK